jgi:predicted nucleic-acid-binding protein
MKPPEKVYLIDTNVILRFLLDDHHEFSPKAATFMLNVAQKHPKHYKVVTS